MAHDDEAPRDPRIPLFLGDPPVSGAHRDAIDPAYYLTREPSARVLAIVAATARDTGDPTPIWMTASIADRLAHIERQQLETQRQLSDLTAAIRGLTEALDPERIARIERAHVAAERDPKAGATPKRARGYLLKAGGVAATLLISALAWFVHVAEDKAAAFQKLDDLIERFDGFDKDIREIRMQLHKLSKADPPSRDSRLPASPDKFSLFVPPASRLLD